MKLYIGRHSSKTAVRQKKKKKAWVHMGIYLVVMNDLAKWVCGAHL